MGFFQSLVDEIIPFPEQKKDLEFLSNKVIRYKVPFSYAFLNAIFQFIDCIVMPVLFLFLLSSKLQGILKWPLIGIVAFSSIFSLSQFLRFFIAPVDNYCSLKDRLLGETALGYFIASLMGLSISFRNN
jgi:hypothetical protein